MEFVNGNRLVAVREGRVMEGKIRMEGSAETFTLVLSRKEVIFPTIMGEDAYGKIDPAHADDEEYERARHCWTNRQCFLGSWLYLLGQTEIPSLLRCQGRLGDVHQGAGR